MLLRVANRFHAQMRRIVLQNNYKYIEGDERLGDPEGFLFDLEESPNVTLRFGLMRPAGI